MCRIQCKTAAEWNCVAFLLFAMAVNASAQMAEPWTTEYQNDDATGPDVVALWQFQTAEELIAMASGAERSQDVMQMTQIIWYRSQTAPVNKPDADSPGEQSVADDFDPTAQYISIAPMHLREAFWTKIACPIKGVMYHGWQSLVPTDSQSAYRFTHPETRHELSRLIHNVVEPLGPMLMQVPAAKADAAFHESFASQMFAGRGSFGWGHNNRATSSSAMVLTTL